MLPTTTHRSTKKKKWVIIGVTALIIAIAAVSIFVMQSKKKGETKTDPVSFEKVTERKLNNTKLISGQVKPGNIESFYADPTKGKVKDIAVKEGQEVEKGTKLFSYD
ncbi:efflux transporter periplasmic adaptor subunit, partial [Bacillus pseudomycoides]